MEALCPTCHKTNPQEATACGHCGLAFALAHGPTWAGSYDSAPGIVTHLHLEPVAAPGSGHGGEPVYTWQGPRRPSGVTFAAVILFINAGFAALVGTVTIVAAAFISAIMGLAPQEFYVFGLLAYLVAVPSVAAGAGALKGRPWARVLGIALLAFWALVSLPASIFVLPIATLGLSIAGIVTLANASASRWFSAHGR